MLCGSCGHRFCRSPRVVPCPGLLCLGSSHSLREDGSPVEALAQIYVRRKAEKPGCDEASAPLVLTLGLEHIHYMYLMLLLERCVKDCG